MMSAKQRTRDIKSESMEGHISASDLELIEDVERSAMSNYISVIGVCVHREIRGKPEYVRLIPELVKRGHPFEMPRHAAPYPLFDAFEYRAMNSLRVLLSLVPELGKHRDERDNTIVHAAAASGSAELVTLALSICPEGLNHANLEGETPLMYGAISGHGQHALSPALRELIRRGCDMNTPCEYTIYRNCGPRQILHLLVTHGYADDLLFNYCVAHGARMDGIIYISDTDGDPKCVLSAQPIPKRYHTMVAAVEACRLAARAILGLGRAWGCVQGNGRDALRLVAKEVWMSRMDKGWETVG